MKKNKLLNIDGELTSIELFLERAHIITQDLTDGYFGEPDHTTENARFVINYEYPRAKILADIVLDYISAAESEIEAIRAIEEAERDVPQ